MLSNSNVNIIRNLFLTQYVVATGLLVAFAAYTLSFSIVLNSFLILSLMLFLSKENFRIFSASFSINIILGIIIAFYFMLKNRDGSPFIGVKDDLHFYKSALTLIKGGNVQEGNHPLYHYINFILLKIPSLVGLKDYSFFNLIIGNSFASALVPVGINNIGGLYFTNKVKKLAVWTLVYFPITIVYSAVLFRDIWLAFFFVWGVYFIIKKEFSIPFKFVLVGLCILGSFYFRTINAAYILCFIIAFLFFNIQSNKVKYGLFFFLILPIIVVGGLFVWDEAMRVYELYTGFVNVGNTSGSIGAKFINSKNPVVKFIYSIIVLYNPIPPFADYKLHNVVIGFGALIWYFIVPGLILSFTNWTNGKKLNRFSFSIGVTLLSMIFVFSMMFSAGRHKVVLYPICFLFFYYWLLNNPLKKTLIMYGLYIISGILAFSVYLIFKLKLFV